MKNFIIYCLLPLFAWHTCSVNTASHVPEVKSNQIIKDTILFKEMVQPILVKNCSPCHFTGGKMYERMPFDKDTTILSHETGILKRIKGDDNLIIKTFIEQNKTH